MDQNFVMASKIKGEDFFSEINLGSDENLAKKIWYASFSFADVNRTGDEFILYRDLDEDRSSWTVMPDGFRSWVFDRSRIEDIIADQDIRYVDFKVGGVEFCAMICDDVFAVKAMRDGREDDIDVFSIEAMTEGGAQAKLDVDGKNYETSDYSVFTPVIYPMPVEPVCYDEDEEITED